MNGTGEGIAVLIVGGEQGGGSVALLQHPARFDFRTEKALSLEQVWTP